MHSCACRSRPGRAGSIRLGRRATWRHARKTLLKKLAPPAVLVKNILLPCSFCSILMVRAPRRTPSHTLGFRLGLATGAAVTCLHPTPGKCTRLPLCSKVGGSARPLQAPEAFITAPEPASAFFRRCFSMELGPGVAGRHMPAAALQRVPYIWLRWPGSNQKKGRAELRGRGI